MKKLPSRRFTKPGGKPLLYPEVKRVSQRPLSRRALSLEHGDLLPVLFLLPTLIIVLIVLIIPFVYGLVISLFRYDIGTSLSLDRFIGLGNYTAAIADKVFLKSTLNTVLFSLLATAGDLFLGTMIAVLLMKLRQRASGFLRAVFMMPLLVSPIIVGLIWRYMYDPTSGLIYWILSLFHLGIKQVPGLTSGDTALLSVCIAHWWQVTPFVILVVTAGLVSIPQDQYEAAHMDGANAFAVFFRITLPQLTRMYMVILIVSGVDTIKVFDIIYALTQGGPANSTLSLSIYAYKNAFEMYRMGYAMAISVFTMGISFLLFGVPFIWFNHRKG